MARFEEIQLLERQEWLLWVEKHAILPIKWLTLALCTALVIIEPGRGLIPADQFALLVFYAAANFLFSYLFYFNRVEPAQVRLVSLVSFIVDLVIVTLFVYVTGGLESDFFILYFLVILRGTGFFDSAYTNIAADFLIALSYVAAIFARDFDTEILLTEEFITKMTLVWGVILMSWLLFRIQSRLKDRILEANRQLSLQQEFDRDVLAAMSNCVIATDSDMRIIRINHAARDMLGLPPEAQGEDVYVLKNELGQLLEQLRQGHRDIEDRIMKVTALTGDVVTLRVTANSIVGDDGRFLGTVCVFEDISQVRKLEEQLIRSEKLASVGELAAGIAHEIGNPISIIKSCAELLADQLARLRGQGNGVTKEEVESLAEDVEVVAGEADRCDTIVRDLLSFSQPEKGELVPSDANEVVERAVSLVSYQKAAAQVELVADLGKDLPPARTDEKLLSQALVNLLLNAVQAMDKPGEVRARTRRAETDTGPRVRIDIIDQGAGIEESRLGKIYTPFFTTRERGTGLGLSIVARIVEQLEGELSVDTKVGRGTTFTLLLPATPGTEAPETDPSSAAGPEFRPAS